MVQPLTFFLFGRLSFTCVTFISLFSLAASHVAHVSGVPWPEAPSDVAVAKGEGYPSIAIPAFLSFAQPAC